MKELGQVGEWGQVVDVEFKHKFMNDENVSYEINVTVFFIILVKLIFKLYFC